MKYSYKQHIKKIRELLEKEGINLDNFLLSYKKYVLASKRNKSALRKVDDVLLSIKVNKELYFSFLLICYSFQINPKRLLEAFMNCFIALDERSVDILEIIKEYENEEEPLFSSDRKNEMTIIKKIYKKMKEHNMSKNDIKKYLNIK